MSDRPSPNPPGVRATRQRAAIVEALRHARGFRSAQELHDEMRHGSERVGLTTVYRNLQALAASGDVDVLRNSEGEAIYRLCDSSDHHHHLVCRTCGLSVEIENPDFEAWVAKTAKEEGFSSITHIAAVYGLCSNCSPT